jgi:hypothetical protein
MQDDPSRSALPTLAVLLLEVAVYDGHQRAVVDEGIQVVGLALFAIGSLRTRAVK